MKSLVSKSLLTFACSAGIAHTAQAGIVVDIVLNDTGIFNTSSVTVQTSGSFDFTGLTELPGGSALDLPIFDLEIDDGFVGITDATTPGLFFIPDEPLELAIGLGSITDVLTTAPTMSSGIHIGAEIFEGALFIDAEYVLLGGEYTETAEWGAGTLTEDLYFGLLNDNGNFLRVTYPNDTLTFNVSAQAAAVPEPASLALLGLGSLVLLRRRRAVCGYGC